MWNNMQQHDNNTSACLDVWQSSLYEANILIVVNLLIHCAVLFSTRLQTSVGHVNNQLDVAILWNFLYITTIYFQLNEVCTFHFTLCLALLCFVSSFVIYYIYYTAQPNSPLICFVEIRNVPHRTSRLYCSHFTSVTVYSLESPHRWNEY